MGKQPQNLAVALQADVTSEILTTHNFIYRQQAHISTSTCAASRDVPLHTFNFVHQVAVAVHWALREEMKLLLLS